MAGEYAEGKKGGEQNGIRKGPLKGHLWNLVEKVFEDEVEGSLMIDEYVDLLEEEDNNVDKDQTAQGETEDFQKFTDNITLKGPIAFKHFQQALSTSVG
jgi:hypothetical protein